MAFHVELTEQVWRILCEVDPFNPRCVSDKLASIDMPSPQETIFVVAALFAKVLHEPYLSEAYADVIVWNRIRSLLRSS